jgi:hypothetical protein
MLRRHKEEVHVLKKPTHRHKSKACFALAAVFTAALLQTTALAQSSDELASEASEASDYYGDMPDAGFVDDEGEALAPDWVTGLFDNTVATQFGDRRVSWFFNADGTAERHDGDEVTSGQWIIDTESGEAEREQICFAAETFLVCLGDLSEREIGDSWELDVGDGSVTATLEEGRPE